MQVIFRKATFDDCRNLSKLKRDVWLTTYTGIYPQEKLDGYDVDKNESIFRSFVERQDIELFLAESNGETIGLMTVGRPYKLYEEYEQEVALLYIRKDFQRQGIGRKFLEIARDEVRQKGFDRFVLAVNDRNENAIAFYLAMGGTIVCQDGGQKRIVFYLDEHEDKHVTHEMQLQPEPFAMIQSGSKTIELRLYDEKRRKIQVGDTILFTNTKNGEHLSVRVLALSVFDSFEELYRNLPLLKCGYTEEDIASASPDDMDAYYSKEKQKEYGVVGITIVLEENMRTNPSGEK